MARKEKDKKGFLARIWDKLLDYWAGIIVAFVFAVLIVAAKIMFKWIVKPVTLPVWVLCLAGCLLLLSTAITAFLLVKSQHTLQSGKKADNQETRAMGAIHPRPLPRARLVLELCGRFY